MLVRRTACLLWIGTLSFLTSCGGEKKSLPEAKIQKHEVVSVTGIVTVDGTTTSGVHCRCVPQVGVKPGTQPRLFTGVSNDDGEFTPRMYPDEVGIPPGKYAITFIWPSPSMGKRGRKEKEEQDRFKGKYANVDENSKRFDVELGKPVDLGKFDLTSK